MLMREKLEGGVTPASEKNLQVYTCRVLMVVLLTATKLIKRENLEVG